MGPGFVHAHTSRFRTGGAHTSTLSDTCAHTIAMNGHFLIGRHVPLKAVSETGSSYEQIHYFCYVKSANPT